MEKSKSLIEVSFIFDQEVRTFQLDESLDFNDEMDMSDEDAHGSGSSCKRARIEKPKRRVTLTFQSFRASETNFYSQENSSPRSQYHDSFSDAEVKESDSELKNKQIKVLQETIRNLQRKMIETNAKEKQNESKISELEEAIRESNVKELLLRTKIANAQNSSISQASTLNDDTSETSSSTAANHVAMKTFEPQLISLSTAYLVIHPKGVKLESLFAYIQQFMPSIGEGDIQEALIKNDKLFSVIENSRWVFNGFNKLP